MTGERLIILDAANTIDPGTGQRVQESGVSFSAMIPIEALLTKAAWAAAMEAIRLQLLEDEAVLRAVKP